MVGIGTTSSEMDGGRPFWPPRNWWLALLVILVLAGALRYPGYDFSLPYLDQPDEVFFALSGRMIIDFGSAKPIGHHHYPPGIISIYYVVMRLFHDPSLPPASVIWIVRLIAITTSLGVISLLGLLGYHALGRTAGLFGAALWSITPLFVERSRWGTAEIFVAFFSILALYLTFVGTRYRRESWTTHATYALMLAILFKYHCVFLAPVVLFMPLWGGGVSRRRVLANTGRFVLFTTWFLLLTPVLEAYFVTQTLTNTNWVPHVQIREFPNPMDMFHNLRSAFGWFDWQILLPGWLGLGLIAADRSLRSRTLRALSFLFSSLFLWLAGISLFGEQGAHAIRFLFAWVTLSVMLSGWGYALLLRALDKTLIGHAPRRRKFAVGAAVALLLAIHLPNAWEAADNAWQATLPDQRNFLANWADGTLPASKYVTNFDNRKTLSSSWGGYTGETRFEYVSNPLSDTTSDEWHAQNLLFAIASYEQYNLWREGGTDEFATQTTLLKSYPPSDAFRGPAMVVLLLQRIQHEATGKLGPIRLIGYDQPVGAVSAGSTAGAGQSLPFHLYWQAEAATATNYQVFNHLLDAEGNLIAQIDGPPLPDPLLRRGTMDWSDPEEIIYSREYALALPEDLPPGQYSIVTGFYRRDNGQRLLTPTGKDSLWVTSISVE